MRSEVRSNSRLFRLLSRSLLKEGFAIRFSAHGRSMFPAIADGEVVEVHPLAVSRPGDVVLIDGRDGLRTHRVVHSTNDTIVTRGDACSELDACNRSTSIIGRVVTVITQHRRRTPHTLRSRIRQFLSRLH